LRPAGQGPPGSLSGTGTVNTLPMFSTATAVASSNVFQSTSGATNGYIGISTTTPQATLDVNLGTINAGVYDLGGAAFAFGDNAVGFSGNVFVGFSGNLEEEESQDLFGDTGLGTQALGKIGVGADEDTAIGTQALANVATGSDNTAVGFQALFNTTGSFNTAIGDIAGATVDASPISGSNNTFLGTFAQAITGTFSNATAIGADSVVGESNALVLGSISGLNNATASVNVGIGTTTPAYLLDVTGIIRSTAGFRFPDGSVQTTAASGGGGGAGGISDVIAGTGLVGGGTNSTVTLTVLNAGSSCAAGNAMMAFTPSFVCTPIAGLAANTFTGNQTINANETINGNETVNGDFTVGGSGGFGQSGNISANTISGTSLVAESTFIFGEGPILNANLSNNTLFLGYSAGGSTPA
jgi:hypothetical protein